MKLLLVTTSSKTLTCAVEAAIYAYRYLLVVALLYQSAEARAEYKSEWQVREYIAGRTLQGITARDRERWHVKFEHDGSFMMQHTNGRRDRGTWIVEGRRLQLMFRRGGTSCRHIFVSPSGDVEWHNCDTKAINSIIESPSYDHSKLDGANVRKARAAEDGLRNFQDIVGSLPSNTGSQLVEGIAGAWMRVGINQILSPEGQRLNAASTLRSLQSGQREFWQNPSAGEQGFVQPGRIWQDPLTGQRRQEVTSVIEKDGRQYQTTTEVCHTPEGPRPCPSG